MRVREKVCPAQRDNGLAAVLAKPESCVKRPNDARQRRRARTQRPQISSFSCPWLAVRGWDAAVKRAVGAKWAQMSRMSSKIGNVQ